jgi:hypothetical protein
MSIGTFCLRTIVIELQTKQISMVKKKMKKKTTKNDTSPMEVGIY